MNVLSTEFYATSGRHTDVTGFGLQVSSVEEAVRVVQGLLVYDLAAKDLYGVGSAECSSVAAAFSAINVKAGAQSCSVA